MLLGVVAVAVGAVARLLVAAARRTRPHPSRPGPPAVGRLPAAGGLLAAGAACVLVGSRGGPGRWALVAVVGGYVLLVAFAAANRAHPGMLLAAVGLLANATVIALNGAMPVAGGPAGAVSGDHRGLRPGDRLTGLADVIGVPLVAEKVSAGDVVASLGGAVAVFAWTAPRRTRQPRRA